MLRVLWNRDGSSQGPTHHVNGNVYTAATPYDPFFITNEADARALLAAGVVVERPWRGGPAPGTPQERASLPDPYAGFCVYDEATGGLIYRNAANTGWLDAHGNALPEAGPAVTVTTSPVDEATGVATSVYPTATFSVAMRPATITAASVYLKNKSTGAIVSASVALNGAGTIATITPSAPLSSGTVYQLVVTQSVRALSGDGLAAWYVQASGFTTAA